MPHETDVPDLYTTVPRYSLTDAEKEATWRDIERADPAQWRRCYPRIYNQYKPDEYASPKHVARQMFVAAGKIESNRVGDSERYEIMWASTMAQYQTPVYWVTRDLIQAIMHTTPPYTKLDWYHMPMPKPAAAFLIPKGELVHPVEGECQFLSYSRHKIKEEIPALNRSGPHTWSSINGSMILFSSTKAGYFTHYNVPYDYFPDVNLKDVTDVISRYEEHEHTSAWVLPGNEPPKMTQADMVFGKLAAHFLFGIVLFMMRKPELVEPGKRTALIKPKRAGELTREYWDATVIGRNYKIRRVGQELGGTHASPRGHWVDGFWRDQHFGPGNKEVKQVLIDPYWRGGDVE